MVPDCIIGTQGAFEQEPCPAGGPRHLVYLKSVASLVFLAAIETL